MRFLTTLLLGLAALPSPANAQARPRAPRSQAGIAFPACYSIKWDSMAGLWDSPLPKAVRLTHLPAGQITADSLPTFRAAASFYWLEPSDSVEPDSDWSRHPVWVQASRDSIHIYVSGRVDRRVWYIRARLTRTSLIGSIGYTGFGSYAVPYHPLMTFEAPRTPCDSSVPSN
jgi:hypothetical protein